LSAKRRSLNSYQSDKNEIGPESIGTERIPGGVGSNLAKVKGSFGLIWFHLFSRSNLRQLESEFKRDMVFELTVHLHSNRSKRKMLFTSWRQ